MESFAMWLKEEMERQEIGLRELARRSGVSPAGISKILNQYRGIGPEMCRSLAMGLGLPEEEVFQRAGLLSKGSPTFLELWQVVRQLSTAEQEDVLRYALGMRRPRAAGASSRSQPASHAVPTTTEK